MVAKLLKKVPGDIKGATLMALIYFLYSVFDARYALKAEVHNLALDINTLKAETRLINERTKRIEIKFDAYLEKKHDRKIKD